MNSTTSNPNLYRVKLKNSSKIDQYRNSKLYNDFFKRLFDILIVIFAAPFILVLCSIIAIAIAIEGGNPFYSQKRIGKNSRVFKMWKFRTMVPNAKAILADTLAQNPSLKKEWDETQKLKNDPRVTRIGAFLRKSSLDELPQLWNVILGEMSIVGPRPFMPEQIHLYAGNAYYEMRPGLTGLWQVSERNESSFSDRSNFDETYYASLSFRNDLRIMAATVNVVAKQTGY